MVAGIKAVSCVLSLWEKIIFPTYRGYDYTEYMDYMDLDVHCPRKAVKHNQSLTHYLMTLSPEAGISGRDK